MSKYVWLLKNDYLPDSGSFLEGLYTTKEKAEEALNNLDEYGFNEEDLENFEIEAMTIRR